MRFLLPLLLFLALSVPARAEFEHVQLVLLRSGPKAAEIPPAELERIQAAHLAHLGRLTEEGKILVAGPFDEQPDPSFRGMCLYRVGSVEEARRLAEADPAVQAGRLRVEAMTWWFDGSQLTFPQR